MSMGAMRFQVIDLGEDAAKATNVDRLFFELSFAHEDCKQGQNLLRAPQRKSGDKD